MLHLILGILKVTGILLLVLLGLLILGMLAVLFVPVHYRLAGRKEKQQLEGQIGISWLFHLISLTADYKEKQLSIRLKLFGISIRQFGAEKTERRKVSGRKKSGRKKRQKVPTEERTLLEEKDSEKPDEEKRKPEKINSEEIPFQREQTKEPDTKKANLEEANPEEIPFRKKKPESLFSVPEKLLDAADALSQFLDEGEEKWERLEKKKRELVQRAQPFLTDSSKALYGRLLVYLKNLWKHYRFRKIRGWIRYGTGAPDITGELTGLFYLILPETADHFSLLPEFTEAVFEMDAAAVGSLRACHLAKTAWLMWREEELKKLIRRVRTKGGKEDGR